MTGNHFLKHVLMISISESFPPVPSRPSLFQTVTNNYFLRAQRDKQYILTIEKLDPENFSGIFA